MLLRLWRSRSKLLAFVLPPVLVVSCGEASLPAPQRTPVKVAAASSAGIAFQAELGPIAALAWSEPFLWIGSDRGLRRFRLATGDVEWVAGDTGLGGRRVTALAAQGDSSILVGTEAGLGRVTEAGGKLQFQSLATIAGLSGIEPVAPTTGNAAWLATNHGLFFFNGTSLVTVGALARNTITCLHADADGRSVWVGVRGRGIAHADRSKVLEVFGPESPGAPDFVETLGMAALPNGTPFAIGRGRAGAGRMALLHGSGVELLVVEPSIQLVGVAAPPTGPLLFAAVSGGTPSTFALALAERGEAIAAGEFRFAPSRMGSQGLRVVGSPDGRQLPADVTALTSGSADVFFGTRAAGLARLGAADSGHAVRPEYLPAGEIAWKARALHVACLERDRCVVATGAGPGWIWDGGAHAFQPVPPEALGSPLMALAGDGAAAVYFMASDGSKGVKVARLSSDGRSWDPLLTVPIDTEGVPLITYATVSPQGNLWMAVRDRLPTGDEPGRGIIEVQLPSGHVVHHRATHAGETRPREAIPVPGDVRAVHFSPGTAAAPDAIWFCTSLGVVRWSAGKLTRWSENDGLSSDSCNDIAASDDGSVWVATRAGAARFDGKAWAPLGVAAKATGGANRWPSRSGRATDDPVGDPAPARSLVKVGGNLWAGTSRGVWPVTATGRALDARSGLVDDDVVGTALDRFGRLWVLGHLGLTVTDTFPLR